MKRPQQPPQQKTTVELPPGEPEGPYVDPRVPQGALSPADAYRAGLEARRAKSKLPKVDMPVAGGEGPAIPRLDRPPAQEGLTMEQLAHLERGPQAPADGFVEPPSAGRTPELRIMPMDVLPNAAKDDPEFREGNGAMFAANQKHLALKYGVIRNGKPIPPQQLVGTGDRQLRPETLQDIRKIQELQAQQNSQRMPDGSPSTEVSDAGRAAATVGNVPGDNDDKPLTDSEKQELEKAITRMDEFQFDAWRQAMMKDILNNPEQKEIIEERLEPMDVGDLVTTGFLVQKVPIVPGKFEVSFMTQDGETDLALKRLIMEDTQSLGEITERYYLDRFAFMAVAAAIYAINGKPLPDHRDDKGNFDPDKFRHKFNIVLKYPIHMLASIGVNVTWFEARVRALFRAEKLGNG